MEVLLFAGLAEVVGARSLEVESPETVGQLIELLHGGWPALAGQPFRVAVDHRYASAEQSLAGAREVALIPPVSGG
ncbi:MAG: molybdopterin synthase sulfur carrier subunit [Pseudohongiellaceae bacterium]|jgi:molybdopterin synthase sulfur carrier subunit